MCQVLVTFCLPSCCFSDFLFFRLFVLVGSVFCRPFLAATPCSALQEEKFRSINLDNNAYKTRIASCIGGTAFLKSVGFAKESDRLFMSMEVNTLTSLILAPPTPRERVGFDRSAQLFHARHSYTSEKKKQRPVRLLSKRGCGKNARGWSWTPLWG